MGGLANRLLDWAEEPASELTGFARKALLMIAVVVVVMVLIVYVLATFFYIFNYFFIGLIWLGVPTLILAFLAFRSTKGSA